jgi:hypothetical protein
MNAATTKNHAKRLRAARRAATGAKLRRLSTLERPPLVHCPCVVVQVCPDCDGKGHQDGETCYRCDGQG